MQELIYYVAASLDGFIADAHGGVGWLEPFQLPEEDYGYARFLETIGGLIMGRKTYDQLLGFGEWPYPGKPCRVLTHRPLIRPADGVAGTAAAPAEIVEELAALGADRIWMVGGAEVFQAFRAASLITDTIISMMPVLLGTGVPLFPAPGPQAALRLRDVRCYANGVVQLHYGTG